MARQFKDEGRKVTGFRGSPTRRLVLERMVVASSSSWDAILAVRYRLSTRSNEFQSWLDCGPRSSSVACASLANQLRIKGCCPKWE